MPTKPHLLSVTALCWALLVSGVQAEGDGSPQQSVPSPSSPANENADLIPPVSAAKVLTPAPAAQTPAVAASTGQEGQVVLLTVRFIERTSPLSTEANQSSNGSNNSTEKSTSTASGGMEAARAIQPGVLEPAELTKTLEEFRNNRQFKTIAEPALRLRLGIPGRYLSGYEVFPKVRKTELEVTPATSQVALEPLFIGTRVSSTVSLVQPGLLKLDLQIEHTTEHGAVSPATGLPGCEARRLSTQIYMKPGQTLLLRGLKAHRKIEQTARVPVLGDLPIVGEKYFTDRTTEEVETELILLATLNTDDESQP